MDEQFDTPVENQVPSTEPTTPPEQGSEQQPQETTTTPEQNPGSDTAQQNNRNAQRRIRQRNATNKRIAELQARIAELEGKDDDVSKFSRQQLEDRIGDMTAISQDDQTEAFRDAAYEFFGEETEQFMQDTYRYAEYVNNNEPDLLMYAQRQYGPILLHEWYKRMDNPQLRQQWLGFTRFEKNMVLNKYYNEITQIISAYKSGKMPTKQAPAKTVPVPNGGRQTPTNEPSDDFGVELQRAVGRHTQRT